MELTFKDTFSLITIDTKQFLTYPLSKQIRVLDEIQKGLDWIDRQGLLNTIDLTKFPIVSNLLPVKTKTGLIFPKGKFSGIWTSIELQFARKYGYKIKDTKGYQFNTSENVFNSYVETLSKLKNELTGTKRQVIKSLLNNLLGRFAINNVKPITKTVNKKVLDNILATRVVKTFKEINSENFVLTFIPLLDKEVCESHNIDYHKAILNERSHNIEKFVNVFQDTSIIISAFTTAYARVHMNQIKLDILTAGGLLYSSDTDSIITDLSMDKLKEVMPGKVGKELGLLKYEYKISKGYFISNKTYAVLLNDGTIIKKGKGFSTDSVSLFEYKEMYLNSKSIEANRISGKINYALGSVLIDNKKIIIDWNSFKKRDKIFEPKTNLWVDTRPLYIDNLTKSITFYVPKDIIKFAKPFCFDYDNLSRSLVVYVPKNIILFTSQPKPKVIFELCNANEQVLNDNQGVASQIKINNIIETPSLHNRMLSFACLFSKHFWCMLRGLRRVSYSYTPRTFIRVFDSLRREEVSNTSLNIFYLNSFLIFGVVLCLFAPILIYYFTGWNIYDYSSILESVYSSSLFSIRITFATVLFNFIVLLACLNYNRLKLTIFNKPITLASTIIVKTAFEGSGEPNLEEQNAISNHMQTEDRSKISDPEKERSVSPAQKESTSNDSTVSLNKTEVREDLAHGPFGLGPRTSEPKSEKNVYPDSPMAVGSIWSPIREIKPISDSNFDQASSSEDKTTKAKKVRFNEQSQLFIIPNLDEEEVNRKKNKEEREKLETSNRQQYRLERAENVSYNSDPTATETYNGNEAGNQSSNPQNKIFRILMWKLKYPKKK